MKKILLILSFVASFVIADEKTIIIGSTPTPYGEIIAFAKPLFEKRGFKIIHKEFNDYVTPDLALQSKDLDANFYQHKPFMEAFNKNNKANLVSLGAVVLVPMAIYSNKIKNLKDLKQGARVAIPNDPSNEARSLELLQKAGLIEFQAGLEATPSDISKNPKKLKFDELKAAQLPRALSDVDIAVIMTNYALGAGLNPLKDGLFLEDKTSNYAIILAVRKGEENTEKSKILKEILQGKEVGDFVRKNFDGAVIPAN
ncbi:methionine ABC transporter substrate-binding protein [Campylobacter sp. MIT 99-7217]|uniref:MetQ/NlpA family ABC transporter substrate-binding protein n=1 Tax=Campylobacter sp. MIT 99-7217 TaxID=535091 RepID=UPI001157424E|nr:MetQ/NlpA family ABC transporter substrate-binding protein [Campylobacter sp. MIT 99-7217]TQR34449.1 methionine ABC transporter substrate-binding protein [Campylobacter sp. MIT 99-7217]